MATRTTTHLRQAVLLFVALCSASAVAQAPQAPHHPVSGTQVEWEVTSLPAGCHSCNSCKCGICLECVDRGGDGLMDDCAKHLGVGPCLHPKDQCWQCPYRAPFDQFGPGEYAGPARLPRIPEYRLRTGDQITLMFTQVALRSEGSYRLAVGDSLLIESEADEKLTRGDLKDGLVIQPDGTITLRLIGQVHAAGQTVDQLRSVINERYKKYYPDPAIDVTPVQTGSAAIRIRDAISGAGGFDPQQVAQTITPSGEIRLPRIGSVQAQGLTLEELKEEINLRYDEIVGGLDVEPSLETQAPHNIWVLGEVNEPGRYDLENSPTTVLGAIAMAGGHIPGANLRQVVIFRRGDNWELLSTTLDLRAAILGREAHPCDEIWLRDNDVVIVPAAPIRLFNNFVKQVFTDGIYGVFPVSFFYDLNTGDTAFQAVQAVLP